MKDVLLLSTDRNICVPGSRSHERMRAYAQQLSSLHIIVLSWRSQGFSGEYRSENMVVYPTNTFSRAGSLVRAYQIGRSLVRRISHVVLSAQDPFEIGLLSCMIARSVKKVQLQVHGDFFGNDYWKKYSILNRIRSVIGIILLRKVGSVRVVSERVKESLSLRGVLPQSIVVLPVHADLSKFVCEKGDVSDVSGTDDIKFLFVGRFENEKNILGLIEGFALHATEWSNTTLELVGKGSMFSAIEASIEKHALRKRVTVIPWTDDIPACLRSADALVLNSYFEGYGMVIPEALVSGVPVISTDVGCVGEVLQHEKEGLVLSGHTPEALRDALNRFVSDADLRTRLTRGAKRRGEGLLRHTFKEYVDRWVASLMF